MRIDRDIWDAFAERGKKVSERRIAAGKEVEPLYQKYKKHVRRSVLGAASSLGVFGLAGSEVVARDSGLARTMLDISTSGVVQTLLEHTPYLNQLPPPSSNLSLAAWIGAGAGAIGLYSLGELGVAKIYKLRGRWIFDEANNEISTWFH
jgi:hypothetical protein